MAQSNAKPDSYAALARDVVRSAATPLTFAEIFQAVSARRPVTTRNPKSTIRTAISNTRLIAALGDGRYGWLPNLITGSVVRLLLDEQAVAERSVTLTDEGRDLLWPGFFEGNTPANHGPVRVALADSDEVELSLEHFFGRGWRLDGHDRLQAWLNAQTPAPGDALIVSCLDGAGKRYAASLERRAARDEATIAERNNAIVVALVGRFRKNFRMPMEMDLSHYLLATGQYRHPVPPDPLTLIWTRDALSDDAPGLAFDYFADPLRTFDLDQLVADRRGRDAFEIRRPAQPSRLHDTTATAGRIYRFKVRLRDIAPPIWRRIDVPADILLADLHQVLQTVMGWYDAHLHQFERGEDRFATPGPEDWEACHDERVYRLNQIVASIGDRLTYTYDFGDDWRHDLSLEAIVSPEADVRYPRCLKGVRACPPDDVGGPWGYADFLKAINNPRHPEHDSMLTWVGGSYDPEAFDLVGVNRALTLTSRRAAGGRSHR